MTSFAYYANSGNKLMAAELFQAMVKKTEVVLTDPATGCKYKGLIQSIELEDGSGYNFNVKLAYHGDNGRDVKTIFVRTPRPTSSGHYST